MADIDSTLAAALRRAIHLRLQGTETEPGLYYAIAHSAPKDWGQYQRMCGEVAGLELAYAFIQDTMQTLVGDSRASIN